MSSNRITNIFVGSHYKILSLLGVVLAVSAALNATAVIAISSDFFWCIAGLALAFEGYIDHASQRQREERQADGVTA